jgi:signal transduction histidine kinase
MYSPIRESQTGRIIAVAEFYENAQVLQKNLLRAHLQTWAVVAAAFLLMFAALFGIVSRGSRTIVRQRAVLERRIEELSELLRQNEALRARVQRASRRTTEINEHYLRRISADLHDGPAQLLSLALLRLDVLDNPGRKAAHDPDVDTIRRSLVEAIAEIRNICAGLTLPDVEHLSLDGVIRKATAAHQRRTSTAIAMEVPRLPTEVPRSLKICAFRFVEEALNNAFRHAGGQGQAVTARFQDRQIAIEVSDSGPGMALPTGPHEGGHRLGLPGLQERIESLGGELGMFSVPGEGTRLTMRCGIDAEENHLD